MVRKRDKNIIMKPEKTKSSRIFGMIVGTAAFAMLYLTVVCALPQSAIRCVAVLPGIAVVGMFLAFPENKKVKWCTIGAVSLYSVFCIAVNFTAFRNGMFGFFDSVAQRANENMHFGFASFDAEYGYGSDFLFASVLSVWLALGSGFALKKPIIFIGSSALVLFVWLCLGLFPALYTVVFALLADIGLLVADRGFSLKPAVCYLLCAAVALSAVIPCYLFSGSDAIVKLGNAISTAFGNIVYGSDGLPEGKLQKAGDMHASDKTRLKVTLSAQTSTLYLKGFVGSALKGDRWFPTDKNSYVTEKYRGLMNYISSKGIPVTQYSEYLSLCDTGDRHTLSVENVSANRRYIYTPYAVSEFETGSPYYDMNLRGGVFTSKKYTFAISHDDAGGERVTQAYWVFDDDLCTSAMSEYLKFEGQYRAFVYDTYLELDEAVETVVRGAIGDFETGSVNTATQFIRAYFLDGYTYSDNCDMTGENFITDFFGGEIKRAGSAHFASAATCMFRAMGFASRYAEGYFVSVDADETAAADHILEITDKNAHAWSEVYFDGVGWLPIEVTPTYFSEQPPDVTVDPDDPDNPNVPDNSVTPELPPDDPTVPDPDKPPVFPDKPLPAETAGLLIALKILLPILAAALVGVSIALYFVVRRQTVTAKKRTRLDVDGEDFGRVAYGIMQKDLKPIGGLKEETLLEIGVKEEATARFIKIVERCVYGGYSVNESERSFVVNYIEKTSDILTRSGGKLRALYYKYVRCVGI